MQSKLDSKFNAKIDWHKPEYNIHWMTPIIKYGYMYGIAGRHQRGAEVFVHPRRQWRRELEKSFKMAVLN